MIPDYIDQPLVFLDLETTGANFARDRILEIGLVEVDRDGVREWSSLVNPGVTVTPFITDLTGIDDAMVVGAPRFEELASALQERLRGRIFIAHNARFDHGFLKAEFARLGIDFRATVICTVKLSRKLYPQHHRHNLDTLMTRHGISAETRHRALADARVLWDLWRSWHTELGGATVRTITDALTRPPTLPPTLDPALADELPDTAGAYALLDANGTTLLVGKAPNLRQKVLAHFADARSNQPPASLVHRVEWCDAAGEFGARLQELGFQRRLKPIPAELCAWRLLQPEPGMFALELVFAATTDFGTATELFGLYGTPKEARQTLRKLAEAHFLCPALLGLESVKPGKPCTATRSGQCRGTCVGKEDRSRHNGRLITALAKLRLREWPYAGPVALVERDEFGMLEDFHVFDRWHYLGRVRSEDALHSCLERKTISCFDPDIYRIFLKHIQGKKLRLVTLPAGRL
ncbi:MAG: exonuclease domain-containing protein [Rhodocyclaceae bacterium]